MAERVSWKTKGCEKAWWEYLFWEQDPFSDMPLKLVWKYGDDPRIDAEMRRLEWTERMRREKKQQEGEDKCGN